MSVTDWEGVCCDNHRLEGDEERREHLHRGVVLLTMRSRNIRCNAFDGPGYWLAGMKDQVGAQAGVALGNKAEGCVPTVPLQQLDPACAKIQFAL